MKLKTLLKVTSSTHEEIKEYVNGQIITHKIDYLKIDNCITDLDIIKIYPCESLLPKRLLDMSVESVYASPIDDTLEIRVK